MTRQPHLALHGRTGPAWVRAGRAHARGFAYHGDSVLDALALARLAGSVASAAELAALAGHLDGHFAVTVDADDGLLGATDRLRSLPLFYRQAPDGGWTLGDDAVTLAGDTVTPSREAAYDLFLLGYTTGADTVYREVRQVRPAEVVALQPGRPAVATRYYTYGAAELRSAPDDTLRREADEVLVHAFERLLAGTAGRPLLVPLSGGLDSRLVVAMLRRLGRRDVICFTYGRPGNREAAISRQVAERVGYPWQFVPYSRAGWRRWDASGERRALHRAAFQLSAVPHIQDVPAVGSLLRTGRIPADAVVVPGHSGDFLAGSQFKYFPDVRRATLDDTRRAILKGQYTLWDWERLDPGIAPVLQARLDAALDPGWPDTPPGAMAAFDQWFWDAKITRFLINSCRGYEIHGLDWRFPLWDAALMEFWPRLPLDARDEKRFFNQFLRAHPAFGDLFPATAAASPRARLRAAALRVGALHRTARYVMRWFEFYRDPLAWYGLVSAGTFLRYMRGPEGINSFLSRDVLGGTPLDPRWPRRSFLSPP